jgi:hypothetical protein
VRASAYEVVPLADPDALEAVLASALGIRVVVRKRRELWLIGRTRVHLDRVDGLGTFLELEVVLPAGGSGQAVDAEGASERAGAVEAEGAQEAAGAAEAERLRNALAPVLGPPIGGSYADLVERAATRSEVRGRGAAPLRPPAASRAPSAASPERSAASREPSEAAPQVPPPSPPG